MVDFKKGDRVKAKPSYNSRLDGWEGTVIGKVDLDGTVDTRGAVALDGHIFVKWDNGSGYSHPTVDRLELVRPAIDTTKPLEIALMNGRSFGDVPFITMTSEGHILVGPRSGSDATSKWLIFTTAGDFVRSEMESGPNSLKLRNKPVMSTEYAAVSARGEIRSGYLNRDLAADKNPEAVFIVRLHKRDGVVVNVDAVKR